VRTLHVKRVSHRSYAAPLGGYTVLGGIVEIHKPFSIAFVYSGELLSGLGGVIFLIGPIVISDIVV
jgi:hypothetical protein